MALLAHSNYQKSWGGFQETYKSYQIEDDPGKLIQLKPDIIRYANDTKKHNDFLRGLFLGIGLKLVDFKIEFGRYFSDDDDGVILLADEISPDNCRLWDIKTNNKYDKDLFRQELGGLKEAYQEVAERLKILPEKKKYSSSKTEIVK